MGPFRRFLKAAGVAWVFLAGLLAVSLLFPAAGLCGRHAADRMRGRIAVHWYGTLARILGLKIGRSGAPIMGNGLLVANHVSWLDIVALGSLAPLDFVAKQEVAQWPLVGYLGRRVGTLFLRRGDPESSRLITEEMAWRLRRGRRLVLFPEGTSSAGTEVLRFHARLFQPALLAHVPVQAVALAYRGKARDFAPFIGDDEFLPHLWRLLSLDALEVDVSFHTQVPPEGLDRNALAGYTRNQIAETLGRPFGPAVLRAG